MATQQLNQSTRDEIYRRTLEAVRKQCGDNLIGACLEFAWHGYQIIKAWPGAPRTIIQAGTASWPRLLASQDDGVSPTHFTYQWDNDSDLAHLLRKGITHSIKRDDGIYSIMLPEIHVWLGCPETLEVIDFTTGLWPQACRVMTGMSWLAPRPPEYLWALGWKLPDGVHYCPSREAISTIATLLRYEGREYP